ncbi:2910_t:CDS:2 [Diversispora eburnea]|uniref:2910_t:CDS:1 n=1 Tax=Diversispora eburnea TaxID=1213867 RepID=A0A9N8ZKJ2_9GLOM|nr:2910_t:CDS:2 [Diversispora eburnea]
MDYVDTKITDDIDTSFSFSTPSSSKASSVIPDEEYEDVPSSISTPSSSSAGSVIPDEEPTKTDFHRPTKTDGPKLTHPALMVNKTAKTGQISLDLPGTDDDLRIDMPHT